MRKKQIVKLQVTYKKADENSPNMGKTKLPKLKKITFWAVELLVGFFITALLTLKLFSAPTNNYTNLLNAKSAKLEYELVPSGFTSSTNYAQYESSYSKIIPNPQFSYSYTLNSWIKIKYGHPKSIYLVYSDYDQPLSEKNFHKVTYTSFIPSPNQQFASIFPKPLNLLFSKEPENEEIINFTQIIAYTSHLIDGNENKYKPLYLVMIGGDNDININILNVWEKPLSEGEVHSKDIISHLDTKSIFQPQIKFYTAQEILDAQASDSASIPLSASTFSKDSSVIQKILRNYYIQ